MKSRKLSHKRRRTAIVTAAAASVVAGVALVPNWSAGAASVADEAERDRRLASVIRAMARFFWFTVEFGLMQGPETGGELKVYGSGLLSSHGEIEHSVLSPEVQRYPIRLEWVINQGFEIHHYQPLLFVVESFGHLFALVDELEAWMRAGRLDNVAPGEPEVSEADLHSFLHRC